MHSFNMMTMSGNAPFNWQSMTNSDCMHSRKFPIMPLSPMISNQMRDCPAVSAATPFPNIREPKRVKFLVIFDWDDTLFPATALSIDNGKNIEAADLLNLGKSVYKLLEKYIVSFGVENLCIVTNGKKSRVLDSLKMISDLYRACFDGKDEETEQTELERDHNYFAAIYNTLISSHPVPVISAQDLYAVRYPQVTYMVYIYRTFISVHYL